MRISVVTAVLNGVDKIEATILSVLDQKDIDLEYIVVDGGSSDGTIDIVSRYRTRIAVVVTGKDKGFYDAINRAIGMASGESIAILNCGDLYMDDYSLATLASVLRRSSGDCISFGEMAIMTSEGGVAGILGRGINHTIMFLRGCDAPHPTTLIPKALYGRFGLYDLQWKIQADYDLLLRMYLGGVRFISCEKIVVRFAPAGLSKNFWDCAREAHCVRRQNRIAFAVNWLFTFRSCLFYILAGSVKYLKGVRPA